MSANGPRREHAMCNVWFSVKNCFNQPVITQIRATPVDSLLGVICLQPTARDSSTLMKHFTLNPNETMHIRISCAADTSARLLHSILDKLDDCAGAKLIGHLLLEASPVSHVAELENTTISDSFSIAGVLVPGTTFGLSTLSLDFRVAKGDESGFPSHPSTWVCEDIQSSFTILNPSPVSSLNFAITATPCRHAGLRFRLKETNASTGTAHSSKIVTDTLLPVTDITHGTISPGDSQEIAVRLAPGTFAPQRNKAYAAFASQEAVDSAQNEVSRTMQISVHDSDMPLKMAQCLFLILAKGTWQIIGKQKKPPCNFKRHSSMPLFLYPIFRSAKISDHLSTRIETENGDWLPTRTDEGARKGQRRHFQM